MWYIRDIDKGFAVLFRSEYYDEAYKWLMGNRPRPGCGYELIWLCRAP